MIQYYTFLVIRRQSLLALLAVHAFTTISRSTSIRVPRLQRAVHLRRWKFLRLALRGAWSSSCSPMLEWRCLVVAQSLMAGGHCRAGHEAVPDFFLSSCGLWLPLDLTSSRQYPSILPQSSSSSPWPSLGSSSFGPVSRLVDTC